MTDPTGKQLTLPFEALSAETSPKYAAIVKQNWQITFSRQKMGSVYSKRIMGLIAALIKEDGQVQEYYQITADKIFKDTDVVDRNQIYREMKSIVYELSEICFYLEDEASGRIIPRHLLDTTRFENPAGYYDGKLTVAFNPRLSNVVANLAHYSQFELKRYVNFGSWYTMRLYEILEAFRDKAYVEFGIEKYRDMMGCGAVRSFKGEMVTNAKTGKYKYEKYDSHSDAILKTTKEPLKELKGSDLEFVVTAVYADASGRGRRPIEKVRFDFVRKPMTPAERIEKWCSQSEGFKAVYTRLKRFSVSDAVIAKYAPIIGGEKLNKILHEWSLRIQDDAKDKITNPEHYCNKVLKEIAEKIQVDKGLHL